MEKEDFNRRSFIIKVLWTLSGILGVLTTIPIAGALFAPLFRKTNTRVENCRRCR